ncbi:MAG TPA: hypothetical protein VJG65_01810 [Patescibacteria group bacterium]|nr:hypothetical protein [Patescibacteria group bacterium]
MKLALITWLLISFIGIAVFGFLLMFHGTEHLPSGCIAANAAVASCLKDKGGLLIYAFHFDIFRSFSEAILISFFISLFLAFLFILQTSLWQKNILKVAFPQISLAAEQGVINYLSQRKLSHWLKFHQNSPTIIF